MKNKAYSYAKLFVTLTFIRMSFGELVGDLFGKFKKGTEEIELNNA